MVLAALAIGTVITFQQASAGPPSFNCRYAKLPAEVAICQSEDLGDLDRQMSGDYFQLINDYGIPSHGRRQIKREQSRWLKSRNRCGNAFGCIRKKYYQRIDQLSYWRQQFSG
ncbi:MAG: lysozyme inhibitor LprI family protein [Hyphomicrobiales bacterium]